MTIARRATRRVLATALLSVMVTGCAATAERPLAGIDEAPIGAVAAVADGGTLAADMSLADLCRERFGDIAPAEQLRVGLMTDSGSVNDGTFNQFAYEGMQAGARCFGLETTYVASGASDDHMAHLRGLVAQDLDAVITVGYPLTEATVAAAREHPDVAFIGIDQVADDAGDNYARVTFRDDQAGFLAGAAAGLLTVSDRVAVVAGPDTVPPVVALADGFEAGVAHVAPEVRVLRTHIPSFSDSEAGAQQAHAFDDAGADVTFAPAGMTGSGAIIAAAQRGHWVIGVDQDQYLTTFEGGAAPGADRIATSSVKRVDLGVFLQLAELATASFSGGAIVLDAATGGVTYAPAHDADVTSTLHARLEEVRAGMASGAIDVEAAVAGLVSNG